MVTTVPSDTSVSGAMLWLNTCVPAPSIPGNMDIESQLRKRAVCLGRRHARHIGHDHRGLQALASV